MRLFGDSKPAAMALVEQPVSQAYARKARLVFVVAAVGDGLLSATVLAAVWSPVKAVAAGLAIGIVTGLVAAVLVRVWPVLRVVWWWSAEITAATVLVGGSSLLARLTTPWVALGVLAVVALVVLVVRPVRWFVTAWVMCGVVRHRLRVAFAEVVRSANRRAPGTLPLILTARPTPAGERVWLWLRPGLSLADLEGATGRLAVACWASEVRLVRASDRYAALLRVDVSRRDPLTGLVVSPLVGLLPGWLDSPAPVSPAVGPVGLDLADVPEEFPEPPRGGRR